MAVRRFKIVIEYDGGCFHGWQRQPDCRTIQGEIETALAEIRNGPVDVHGSGRTDAGVHALAQVAHFEMDSRMAAPAVKKALNCLLPDGILIHHCLEVDTEFHARFSVKAKTYRYRILNRPLRPAVGRQYLWHVWRKLDREAMAEAASFLVGTHDFKSFEAAGSPRTHTVRTLFDAGFHEEAGTPDLFAFEVTGSGFLRYMVRNLVGTLVQVGFGKIPSTAIPEILEGRNRQLAGLTAPASGLFLKAVHYDLPADFRMGAAETIDPPGVPAR